MQTPPGPPAPPGLAGAIAHAAATINDAATLEDTLEAIVAAALESMSGVDHVGVTLSRQDGVLETAAATDDVVRELDAVQYAVGAGPCVDAVGSATGEVVVLEHLRHSAAYHGFVRRAVPLGLRSTLAVRLFAGERTVGVLNMYSTTQDEVDPETRVLAELFGTHAAYAYGHRHEVVHLQRAMESRELIGTAVGIVMERFGLTKERAFEYLVRVAATSEVKLRVVAEELVRTVGEPRVP